ncbi:hypothetical protein MNBD_UNCLBAC01-1578 [hydrothermal vent metagenome]|uniref:Type II secretion envelope pseudopilin protein (PulG,guides folded protein to PulD in outer membrane) n=1 Tax=hydrothermal vent metagenome TaxID=652676 RepID=A0A3B1DFK8_9ZZZZ
MKLKKMNNKSGFTLLEIIIVIIIVGVLASLALPKFFQTVEFSRSTEATNVLGSAKRSADRCSMMGGASADYSSCNTFSALAMEDPGLSPNAHFCYAISWSSPTLTMVATRNGTNSGDGSGDYTDVAACLAGSGSIITFALNATTGAVTKSGTGPFAGIQ